MPDADIAAPIKALEKLAEEKQSLAGKEKELVEKLNAVLQRMGYHIVPVGPSGMTRRRGRPRKNSRAAMSAVAGGVGKRRGRPPGSKNKPKVASQPPRRRGRPPKAKS
jgi:hypothetical protein